MCSTCTRVHWCCSTAWDWDGLPQLDGGVPRRTTRFDYQRVTVNIHPRFLTSRVIFFYYIFTQHDGSYFRRVIIYCVDVIVFDCTRLNNYHTIWRALQSMHCTKFGRWTYVTYVCFLPFFSSQRSTLQKRFTSKDDSASNIEESQKIQNTAKLSEHLRNGNNIDLSINAGTPKLWFPRRRASLFGFYGNPNFIQFPEMDFSVNLSGPSDWAEDFDEWQWKAMQPAAGEFGA